MRSRPVVPLFLSHLNTCKSSLITLCVIIPFSPSTRGWYGSLRENKRNLYNLNLLTSSQKCMIARMKWKLSLCKQNFHFLHLQTSHAEKQVPTHDPQKELYNMFLPPPPAPQEGSRCLTQHVHTKRLLQRSSHVGASRYSL